jgi:hypothetical protein
MEKRNQVDIEIALWEKAIVPWVEFLPQGTKRCHFQLGEEIHKVAEAFKVKLLPSEISQLLTLWCDDKHPRSFARDGEFLIIRSKLEFSLGENP